MTISAYLNSVNTRFQSGISKEHSYRGDLESLIRQLVPDVEITNEPAKVTDCGNPDYVITDGKIPVGYIEAKDIGKDLNSKIYSEQFTRYKNALDNLIITDYLWFQFFQHGELVFEIRLAEMENGKIKPLPDNFKEFENLIANFCSFSGQTIKSAKKLAEMMAAKARLLQNILENATTSDEETQENTSLQGQYKTFKEILIHDLTPKGFADIYAQTLAYGMFAARLHDPTLEDFSRQEAAELIPKSNPFLRKLFGYVAGFDIDERIKTTVDNLADVFRATDVEQLLQNFGRSTQTQDAIIHFYETFLAEYDAKLRKARGVWYTPEPVVKFIVRAVDDVLKTDFNLSQGLADTSKTKIKVNTDVADKRSETGYKQTEKEVHKVQILDPATGTGTFLAEVVNFIYSKKFKAMQGAWSGYVDEHLIPRLNGFELLMASYAMAHLKLDMLLRDTGYQHQSSKRLQVYLTNSLEEHHKDTGTLFSSFLSSESNEANHIKRDTPVMCVLGNPPYSGISSNNGKWISDLIDDYKYVDGKYFNERKHWLNDDYVKFMRYGQHYIEKNGEGVLAFINPHGFLDNPTFRGMRWNLLKTYDKIYTVDLHGNAKKKETAPNGGKDENVFDIMQGVSINILVKTGQKKPNELGEVFHYDSFGKRQNKYDFLKENSLKDISFESLNYTKPYYFFVPKDEEGRKKYEEGFNVEELFPENVTGVVTARDSVVVDFDKETLLNRIEKFTDESFSDDETRNWLYPKKKAGKYLKGDSRGWKLAEARKNIAENNHTEFIQDFNYRPFDTRKIYYSPEMVDWGREKYMFHFLKKQNLGLMICRQTAVDSWEHIGITNMIADDSRVSNRSKERGYILPLYIYPEPTDQQSLSGENAKRKPNLNMEIVAEIEKRLGLEFVAEEDEILNQVQDDSKRENFTPINLLDYIYAVLHSPSYRETYKEFLKIDFPRVPYPENADKFWQLVELGKQIREIHLLESEKTEDFITSYPVDGSNEITRKITKRSPGFVPDEVADKDDEMPDQVRHDRYGRVYINDEQYFDKVPKVAWEFYIGGYQPAQKWLKDRKKRVLDFEDILHYQKIIVALTETDRLMKEVDKVMQ